MLFQNYNHSNLNNKILTQGLAIPTKNHELATDLTCYQCILDEPCFTDHTDGESAACTEPEYNGCYKAKVGKITLLFSIFPDFIMIFFVNF